MGICIEKNITSTIRQNQAKQQLIFIIYIYGLKYIITMLNYKHIAWLSTDQLNKQHKHAQESNSRL